MGGSPPTLTHNQTVHLPYLLLNALSDTILSLSTQEATTNETPFDVQIRLPPQLRQGQRHTPQKPRRPHARRDQALTCYHPVEAYWTKGRKLTMDKRNAIAPLSLPCRRCIGCRLDHSQDWATRIHHEAKFHDDNCFVTLTFSDENMPWDHSVSVRDLQLFMKRLRKYLGVSRVRFFAAGEYGERGGRPHYHLILFGYDPSDKTPWRTTPSGYTVYRSETLEKIWPFGHVEVGTVTHQSAGYVARYCTKKINGPDADQHYEYLVPDTGELVIRRPEFAVMSRKPGIGQQWWDKYASDAFPSDFLIIDGRKVGVPDYYLRKLPDGEREAISHQRKLNGWKSKDNSTPERLAIREEIQHRKADKLIRKMEQS